MDTRAITPKTRRAIIDFDQDGAVRGAVARFCKIHGISRSVFYKIRSQAAASPDDPDAGLLPAKSGPATPNTPKTSPEMEELVLKARSDLAAAGWGEGPISVRARLVRAGHRDVPSRATIARIFSRNGAVVPEPAKRPRSSYKRFVWPRANDMWQLDGTEWRLDDERNTKQVIYQVEDDHSRMVLAWAIDATENGATAVRVVSDAISRFGVPVRFLTDNGVSFNQSRRGSTAPLERYLKAFGVTPISGSIRKPTTQGKNERLHQTLQKFLQAHTPIATPGRLMELLDEFADGYNNDRPHQELDGMATPAEAYAAAVKAGPPPLPEPAQPDLFDAAETPGERPAGHTRNRPRGAREIGGLLIADRDVGKDGRVHIAHASVYVGARRAGQTLHISITDDHLELFGPDGDPLGVIARPAPTGRLTRVNLFSEGIYCG
jgi:transposase InsO family protein